MRLLCRAVGALICYFPCGRTRVAYANVRHCFPDMDPREVRKTVFESCSRMVEMALFVVASPHMSVKRLAKRKAPRYGRFLPSVRFGWNGGVG